VTAFFFRRAVEKGAGQPRFIAPSLSCFFQKQTAALKSENFNAAVCFSFAL